jgi:hypothetical protein
MRPHTENAGPRPFVVPTNSALDFHHPDHALLLFWLFTLLVLHLFFPIFQHTGVRGFVPLKAYPSIGVDGEHK